MTGLEALQAVQYVTVKKKRFAMIEEDMWEKLIEWLESMEDSQVIKQAYSELAVAGGSRERAGWLRWDDVREKLN